MSFHINNKIQKQKKYYCLTLRNSQILVIFFVKQKKLFKIKKKISLFFLRKAGFYTFFSRKRYLLRRSLNFMQFIVKNKQKRCRIF